MEGLHGQCCNHGGHAPLIGQDPTGAFKTKSAQAYPEELCEKLAEGILKAMLQKGSGQIAEEPDQIMEEKEADPEIGMRMTPGTLPAHDFKTKMPSTFVNLPG